MPLAAKEEIFSTSTDPCALFPLAAFDDLAENSRQGFTRKNPAPHQGSAWSNSASALGIEPALRLEGVRSRSTGKERDSESGLDNFGARYDSSQYGRFMSPDPLGGSLVDPQTLNKYSYVRNNPLTLTDPTGLYTCADDQNKCQTAQDQAFEKARQNDLQSKNADVVRAASAYGDPTKDNGVNVGFADLSKKGEGGVTTSTLGTDPNSGNLRANSNVVIDSNVTNAGGSALDATVGHEGSHVADAQDLVNSITITDLGKGTFTVGQDITQYASEQRAYHVTDSILKSENTHETFQCGVGTCQLGNTVLGGQVTNIVDQILRSNYTSPINHQPLTQKNPGASIVPH